MLVLTVPLNVFADTCGFVPVFQQKDEGGKQLVQVYQGRSVPEMGNSKPLIFIGSLKVNTDGTNISYHQNDLTGRQCVDSANVGPCAINNIRNAFRNPKKSESDFEKVRDAGYPDEQTWKLLSPDIIEKNKKTGKPCINQEGYLVSMTADVAVPGGYNRQGDCDQSKWIDALKVPAIVVPKKSRFLSLGVSTRSPVIVLTPESTRRVVPGIVGDMGPDDELGEASVAMNRILNGLTDDALPMHRDDAKARFQVRKTAVLIFPGTTEKLARPITAERVKEQGDDVLTRFGGVDRLYKCIKNEIDSGF